MLGCEELKETIEVTETTVECPVKGCNERVERQRSFFKKEIRFKCPKHEIYISPSTFEYTGEMYNLLWKDTQDLDLLHRIMKKKRESRMARDNSEDAVSWNVFRFLEKNNLVENCLDSITRTSPKSSDVIYWSYSQEEGSDWSLLNRARREFGERISRGSEPDIIITTDNALFFIEAKLTAGNKTVPSNPRYSKKYETGGNSWFSTVFESDYKTIAIVEKKYELMRFWLLGTWMAEQMNIKFYLINLVLAEREADIEILFRRHIEENQRRQFLRVTWESIYEYVLNSSPSRNKKEMIRYFRNKTIGYDNRGKLQRGFSIVG
ncbi:MAG: hypothetical protein E4H14_16020 [Candidatus Thorarchaeota archaeon]|nr:MAG: hypothetical protein E4H14_16020 [Candidatus Thorarchaeota archaeon]